jgi:hypothetical protein
LHPPHYHAGGASVVSVDPYTGQYRANGGRGVVRGGASTSSAAFRSPNRGGTGTGVIPYEIGGIARRGAIEEGLDEEEADDDDVSMQSRGAFLDNGKRRANGNPKTTRSQSKKTIVQDTVTSRNERVTNPSPYLESPDTPVTPVTPQQRSHDVPYPPGTRFNEDGTPDFNTPNSTEDDEDTVDRLLRESSM